MRRAIPILILCVLTIAGTAAGRQFAGTVSAGGNSRLRPADGTGKSASVPQWLIGHSGKKGICLGGGLGGRTWAQTIRLLHARWVYNWELRPSGRLQQAVHFIPMVWGHRGELPGDVAWLTGHGRNHRYRYLLAFNEPDNRTQSNMTVRRALRHWPKLESTGMVLGSPACVHPDDRWMQAFMRGAVRQHYRVNFVCVHWYGPPSAASFLGMLRRTYAIYHRPIWITEFAVADWGAGRKRPNRYPPAVVARFMRIVLPVLNELKYIQCYAWYPYGSHGRYSALGTSALFDAKGDLTPLGRIYAAD